MKTLFGGSDQQSTSQSGFSMLPPELQKAWKNLGTQATSVLGDPNKAAGMFTLPSLNSGAQSALAQIGKGFTPDASQLQSDINMQTNPYDSSVIDTINREAAGQGSQLDSYYSKAGTFGSNRGALGANDIDLTRLNQIGSFKDQEFQNAMNNALQVLPALRAQSAQGAVQGGLLTQGQQVQNQQAPVSALEALAKITGVLPQSGGSTSQSTGDSQNGMFAPIKLFSDIRLKKNIVPQGFENGHRVYDFTYINDEQNKVYRGVMAQEVMAKNPEAVEYDGSHYLVDYSKIGVKFREIYG